MLKKTLLAVALLALTGLSGCIVVAPPGPYVEGPAVVYPLLPVYGWFGGYYGRYYGYGRGGYGYYRGGGHRH